MRTANMYDDAERMHLDAFRRELFLSCFGGESLERFKGNKNPQVALFLKIHPSINRLSRHSESLSELSSYFSQHLN